MEPSTEAKLCLACGKKLKGRVDKKFCDDYCRNAHNNSLKSRQSMSPLVRNITNILVKNHRILASQLKPGEDLHKVPRERLLEAGFSFKYHTHTRMNKNQQTYHFVFDHGWLDLGSDWFLIVKTRDKEEG